MRADERTRTADLISLRVITQALLGFAGACRCRISKRFSWLCLALCCTVLRSQWCQSGVNCTLVSTSHRRPPPVLVSPHRASLVERCSPKFGSILCPGEALCLSCLHVERDVHRFGEGQVDRAALPPSLVKLLHITFVVGRLDLDVESDVLQVRLGASHAKEAASIRLALRRRLHPINADAQLGGEGVADKDHRAAGQGTQQQGGGAGSLIGTPYRLGKIGVPRERPSFHHCLAAVGVRLDGGLAPGLLRLLLKEAHGLADSFGLHLIPPFPAFP